MAESFTATQQDARTFGQQQNRLLDDLNRPDLANIVIEYLQDAIRFYQRKPFFFSNLDNTGVPQWVANTYYPTGSVIQVTTGGNTYVFIAVQANAPSPQTGKSGAGPPVWPTATFTVPGGSNIFPPPTLPAAGAVQDNTVTWVNVGVYTAGLWTQLATVYAMNQYTPPLDYVAPRLVEITIGGNLRIPLQKMSYPELRSYDVIRPSPVQAYPTWWAWYQQQIYLFPYPNGFYPLTLSYRAAPLMVSNANDSNFWTTIAERMVRKYAEGSIHREVLKDEEAARMAFGAVAEELAVLRSRGISQEVSGGIPSSDW